METKEQYLETISKMKSRLKEYAVGIRKAKPYTAYESHHCRHLHMIYGLLKGRKQEQIEAKSYTVLCGHTLKRIADKFNVELDYEEIVRVSESRLIS